LFGKPGGKKIKKKVKKPVIKVEPPKTAEDYIHFPE